MKKIIFLLIIIFSLTGCININKASIDEITETILNSKSNRTNEYRSGFKYYLPSNIKTIESLDFNEILSTGDINYYLYVDLVSYYENIQYNFQTKENVYYQKLLQNDDKKGYLEIINKNNQYLIAIIYNYAKIEVIVDENKINEAITNSLLILTSIKYNREIISNLVGDNILSYHEESFNIFDTQINDSNFLEYVQEYDNYDENKLPDFDLIKE